MGEIRVSEPVKLFIGIITVSAELANTTENELVRTWGPIDLRSEAIPFTFTGYYEKEMGASLLRQWISFERLIDPGELADIKRRTNAIEETESVDGKRRINLDPGYLTLAKVVLASTKDYSHRIFLGQGIYAEVTLHYKDKNFLPLPWTYPDYQSETALRFLNEARDNYHAHLAK